MNRFGPMSSRMTRIAVAMVFVAALFALAAPAQGIPFFPFYPHAGLLFDSCVPFYGSSWALRRLHREPLDVTLGFGAVIAMPIAGVMSARFGSGQVCRLTGIFYCLALPGLALA